MILTINNSVSNISGLSIEDHRELKNILSYTIPGRQAYFSKSFRFNKRYLIDKKGNFPTGLLYLVEQFLIRHKLINVIQIVDKTKKALVIPYKFQPIYGDIQFYPEQLLAVKHAAISHRGIIVAPTGMGKSLICALIIEKLQVHTLIVVPSLELKTQLTHTLKQIFGFEKAGGLGYPIAIENIDALSPNTNFSGYSCVIIDEFHHSGAKSYRELNQKAWNDIYYRFGLTATPFRSKDYERLLLESVLSHVIYEVRYDTAVKKGYITPLEAYSATLPVVRAPSTMTKWNAVYDHLIVNNKVRNSAIVELIKRLQDAGKQTLVLVKRIEHGAILQNMLGNVPFANGSDDLSAQYIKDFNNLQYKTLIATSIVGEGVDTKSAEYLILAGGTGKSKIAIMQNCGRVLRKFQGKESGKVIAFKDAGHKWFKDHWKFFTNTLREEYNLGIIEIDVDLVENSV